MCSIPTRRQVKKCTRQKTSGKVCGCVRGVELGRQTGRHSLADPHRFNVAGVHEAEMPVRDWTTAKLFCLLRIRIIASGFMVIRMPK
jgi:hypothetical protein